MNSIIITALSKLLMSLLVKLLAESALEDLLVFLLKKLSESTKTQVDDELLAIVQKHLGRAADQPKQ